MWTLLVRNRVEDFTRWKKVFDEQAALNAAAGLELTHLWQDLEDPNNVFFLLAVSDLEKARAYIADPHSAEVGRQAGVLDGEVHFLEGGEA